MRLNFRGQKCVYCSQQIATTADHIFAKKFFLEERRGELPQVPACLACNGRKSQLEHYLASVMPFGGMHKDASQNLSELVPKRLASNLRLHKAISQGATRVWGRTGSGVFIPTLAIPFEGEKLSELFSFIAKGLLWFHWGVFLTDEDDVQVTQLTKRGEAYFRRYRTMRAKNRIMSSVGDGTFEYLGAQGVDNDKISVWEFSIYGGMTLAGDPEAPNLTTSRIGVLTGPKRISSSALAKARWLAGRGTK